jgi:lia operon protein LiaF
MDGGILAGAMVLLLGLIFLFGNLFPHIHFWRIIGGLWPVILIILGLYILSNHGRFRRRNYDSPPSAFNRLVGEMHLSFDGKEIANINASQLIGELTIDLSGSHLRGGKNYLNLSQLIGETTVIVPAQFPIRIAGKLLIGELNLDYRKESGILPRLKHVDSNYDLSEAKLDIIFSGLIGEMTLLRK